MKVKNPGPKYVRTSDGAVETDGDAKVRFFAPTGEDSDERAFLSPQSVLRSQGQFGCPWLVSFQERRTPKGTRELTDATEVSAHALLLFGRGLRAESHEQGILAVERARFAAGSGQVLPGSQTADSSLCKATSLFAMFSAVSGKKGRIHLRIAHG